MWKMKIVGRMYENMAPKIRITIKKLLNFAILFTYSYIKEKKLLLSQFMVLI